MSRIWIRNVALAGLVAPLALVGEGAVAEPLDADERPSGATLPTVKVRGATDATSEGSGAHLARHATVGAKDAVPVLEIPQSVSVITRQRIEDQGLQTVEDALREVTGVTVTPWDGATSQIRSRGYFLEPSHDGIPGFGGLNATQQFDLAMFDRVEVLRGPAGLFQGSGQPGGTVNFVRRQGMAAFGGSAALSAGSWSQYRAEVNVGGALDADGRLRSRLVAVADDGDFHYDRAHSRKGMVYGTLDADLTPDTTVSLYGAWQDDTTNPFSGLPARSDGRFLDVPRSTNPYPGWAVYDTTTTMAAVDVQHRRADGWTLRGRYSVSAQDVGLRDAYPTTGIPASGVAPYARRGWDTRAEHHVVDLYATGPFALLGRRHQATAGWSHGRHTNGTDYGGNDTVPGIPVLDPDVLPAPAIPPYVRHAADETVVSGVYGQVRLSLADALTLVTGARSTDFRVKSRTTSPGAAAPDWTPGARETGEVTPYAGVVVHLAETVTAYASQSEIFMPQTQRDVNGTVLDPRTGRQVELGLKGSFLDGNLQAAAAVFRTRDENRAYPDPGHPGSFVQVGEVEVKGWEAEVTGSPTAGLQATVGYARLDSAYRTHQTLSGTPFTLFEPKHSLKAYAHYRFGTNPWSVGGGARVSSGVAGTGQAGVREQGGYGVVDAQAGYRFGERTSVSLAVNNLFDRTYYARVGTLNSYNTYGEPRSALLTLRTAL